MGALSECRSLIFPSTIPAFSSSLVSKLGQDLQVVVLINRLILRYLLINITPLMLKKTIVIAFTCDLLNLAFLFSVELVSSTASIASSFLSMSFNFTRNWGLMRCSVFILVTNLAQQHKTVILEQCLEANHREMSLALFDSRSFIIDYLPLACFPGRMGAVPLFISHAS